MRQGINTKTIDRTLNVGVDAYISGNLTAGSITAPISGNVTGNLTGNVTGNVEGNLTGSVNGVETGRIFLIKMMKFSLLQMMNLFYIGTWKETKEAAL